MLFDLVNCIYQGDGLCRKATPVDVRGVDAGRLDADDEGRGDLAVRGRSSRSQVAAASDQIPGRASPRARSYSASAKASQPAALGVIAEACAAARRAVASNSRARSSRSEGVGVPAGV